MINIRLRDKQLFCYSAPGTRGTTHMCQTTSVSVKHHEYQPLTWCFHALFMFAHAYHGGCMSLGRRVLVSAVNGTDNLQSSTQTVLTSNIRKAKITLLSQSSIGGL